MTRTLILTSLSFSLLAGAAHAAVLITDDFESDTLGGAPSGWTLGNSPTTFTVVSDSQSPIGDPGDNRGMRLDNDPNVTFENMERGFTAQTGTFYVQFDYNGFAGLGQNHNLQMGDGDVTNPNRGINLTMSTTSGVVVDTWYRFTVTIDLAADDYDLRLQSLADNSVDTTTTGIAFQAAQTELDIVRFWFNTGSAGGLGDYALDNILVTTDSNDLNFTVIPEPSAFALGMIGTLTLGLLRRRRSS
jgi:hypothetical protein